MARKRGTTGIGWLIVVSLASLALVAGCRTPENNDEPKAGTATLRLSAQFAAPASQRAGLIPMMPVGTYADVASVTVDVMDGATPL